MKRFEATKRPASACGRNEKQKNRNNNNNTDRERENPVSSESSLIYNSYYTLEFQQRIAIFPVRLKIHIQIYANRISIRKKKKKSVGPLPNCFFILFFFAMYAPESYPFRDCCLARYDDISSERQPICVGSLSTRLVFFGFLF